MESDDEDDFGQDEVNVVRSVVYQGGKLSDILAEVETKIPSLDFEDCSDDGYDENNVLFHNHVGVGQFENRFSNPVERTVDTQSSIGAKLPEFELVEEKASFNSAESEAQVINSDCLLENLTDGQERVNLDFGKLCHINFTAVEEALGDSTSKNSSLYDLTVQRDEEQFSTEGECYLMGRLSDLSKVQTSVSYSAEKLDNVACSKVYTRQSLDKEKQHCLNNGLSSKAIHSWTQLQPQETIIHSETVFLDLRPEKRIETQRINNKHSTSIQRILGLTEQRSETSSDDDSDSEMEKWREMRSSLKQSSLGVNANTKELKKCKRLHNSNGSGKLGDSGLKMMKNMVEEVSEEELIGGINKSLEMRNNQSYNETVVSLLKQDEKIYETETEVHQTLVCESVTDMQNQGVQPDKVEEQKREFETIQCLDGDNAAGTHRETTLTDIDRFVASAVEMLDELYSSKKNPDKYPDFVSNEKSAALDEKTTMKDEGHDLSRLNTEDSAYSYCKSLATQTGDTGVDQNVSASTITSLPFLKSVVPNSVKDTKDTSTETTELRKTKKDQSYKCARDGIVSDSVERLTKDVEVFKASLCNITDDSLLEEKKLSSKVTLNQKKLPLKEKRIAKAMVKERIESEKPTRSANGKLPVALNTPVIYDQHSSYESECRSLLPISVDQVTLLLVIDLHDSSELNQRSKTSGIVTSLNYYFALVAWFLSLGGNYNRDQDVPFSVIGMQQAYQHGQIQLFVGVQPTINLNNENSNKTTNINNQVKNFNKAISKYLSGRTLRSVYQDMCKIYLNGGKHLLETQYDSKKLSAYITVGHDSNAVLRVFGSKNRYFWETVEASDQSLSVDESSTVTSENMIVLVQPKLYHKPFCLLDLLSRVEDDGCDVAGLRLAYHDSFPTAAETVYVSHQDHGVIHSTECSFHAPTLALAIRGPSAIAKVKCIVGSKVPLLDDSTTAPSLRSLYCASSSEDKLFYCPSYANQASTLLARWFGQRVSDDDNSLTNGALECQLDSSSELDQIPPALLIAYTQVPVYLICSPLVPPSFIGQILYAANIRGFSLHSIKRMHLGSRQLSSLGMVQPQQTMFCQNSVNAFNKFNKSPASSPPGSPMKKNSLTNMDVLLGSALLGSGHPSTVIVLQKENGYYHTKSLIDLIYKLLILRYKYLCKVEDNTRSLYFCALPFNDANNKILNENSRRVSGLGLLKKARIHQFWSHPEAEQVCALYASTREALRFVGLFLKIMYSERNPVAGKWELLAIKHFPNLTMVQALEVTPLEVGDKLWGTNVKHLMSTNVVCALFRGINVIDRICQYMKVFLAISPKYNARYADVDWWFSRTTDATYRQIAVLFREEELSPDESCRETVKYMPRLYKKRLYDSTDGVSKVTKKKKQQRKQSDRKSMGTDESSNSVDLSSMDELSVLESMLVGPRPLTTVALIKPSCLVNTKNLGKIFKSICQDGFKIVAMRMSVLKRSEAEILIEDNELNFDAHWKYLTSGACLLLCLQRENAIQRFLDVLGHEDPAIASETDPFLLRGCYGTDVIHNAFHGSRSYAESVCELRMLFPCGLCCDKTLDLEAEQITCRAVDETIGGNFGRRLSKRLDQYSGLVQSWITSLVQTNCLILTHHVVYGRSGRQKIGFVTVLEYLTSLSFTPVGMKMVLLTADQIEGCLQILDLQPRKKTKLRNYLLDGPCVVLALQRDNAVTCFESIVQSGKVKHGSFAEYRRYIIQGQNEREAERLLLYFFDALVPDSVEEITACI